MKDFFLVSLHTKCSLPTKRSPLQCVTGKLNMEKNPCDWNTRDSQAVNVKRQQQNSRREKIPSLAQKNASTLAKWGTVAPTDTPSIGIGSLKSSRWFQCCLRPYQSDARFFPSFFIVVINDCCCSCLKRLLFSTRHFSSCIFRAVSRLFFFWFF